MKYIIHSKSEKGFWNVKRGWVYNLKQATQFSKETKNKMIKPFNRANDSKFIVAEYDEFD